MKKNAKYAVCLVFAVVVAATMVIPAQVLMAQEGESDYKIEVPEGLPSVPVPDDNPMTKEKVELGKMLFFDQRLSRDGTLSCATCHIPEHGYAEPKPTSEGIEGQFGERNANPVINSAYATTLFWDGRSEDLEDQAAGPMENPIEMGHSIPDIAEKLNEIPEYKKRFENVFGAPANQDTITKAIAAFERTLLTGNSPYDRYVNGEEDAISEEAKAGEDLFKGKALCATCHTPPVFSNWSFYNAGVGTDKEEMDIGRMEVTEKESDKGAFRVPHLRNATDTAPYMHDGSLETLEEAVRFMAEGGKDNPNLHPLFRALKGANLTDEEIDQLVEFVKILKGEYPIVEEPELP